MRRVIWQRAVSVLCALAVIAVAFGHRPIEMDPRLSDPQIAAYLALGGSLSDLCLSGGDGQDHGSQTDCQACTIAKSLAVNAVCHAPLSVVVTSSQRVGWPETVVIASQGARAPPARGPPSSLLI